MQGRLQDKIAIVTGGNDGIGEVTAHRFAQEGAKVAILARREAEGYAVQQATRAKGGEAIFIFCDVSDSSSVKTAVAQTVERYGGLHVLCNNAGIGNLDVFPDESLEGWEQVLKVNLTGPFLMSQAVWPYLIRGGGGSIVNVSSMASVHGFNEATLELVPGNISASYYASKAGIEAFTRYSASVGSRNNIRVNCVRPGQILTPSVTGPDGNHVFSHFLEPSQMIKGPGHPEDVTNTLLFLVSEESHFITAAIINIDGGAVAKV